jgi:hypothetical protein
MVKKTTKTFSVSKKKTIQFSPSESDIKKIKFFSELLNENFAMSEELAKAIGTVVVQALTENAKDDGLGLDGSDDLGLDDDLDLDTSDLPESAKDSGKVQEAEGPKPAPDLSQDFAELKSSVQNHSEKTNADEQRRIAVKKFFSEE